MMKTLFLEKRGCDFMKDDGICQHSDLENYRLCGRIVDKYGRNLFIEFGAAGNRLKGEQRKLVPHYHKLYAHTSFENFDGTWGDLELDQAIWNGSYDYTKKGVLEAVEVMTDGKRYDKIIIADTMPDLCGNGARINDEDRTRMFQMIGLSEEEANKQLITQGKIIHALHRIAAYKMSKDGSELEIIYQLPTVEYSSFKWSFEEKRFIGRKASDYRKQHKDAG